MSIGYDLLVIDLDGTLLTPGGHVTEVNAAAVAEARSAGLEVIVATGRALVESLTPLEAIGADGHVVTAGGSLFCDVPTGRTIKRVEMPHDVVDEVTAALLASGHKVLLLKDGDAVGYDYLAVGPAELDPASEWWFETLPVRVRFVHALEDDPDPHDTVRVGAVATETELAPLAAELLAAVGDRAFLQHWSAVTASEATGSATHLLEVFNRDVSKWTMISAYCDERGIERERVACIGDGLNDVEIVRESGLGIAMGNADDRVLAVADRVTDDNRSDGVSSAISRILSGDW